MFKLIRLGSEAYCIHCKKVLTYEDYLPLYVDGVKINLPHFCITCCFSIPYIHNTYCKKCGSYKACYNNCEQLTDLQQNFSSLSYNDEVKTWLHLFKFAGQVHIGDAMKPLIHLALARFLRETGQRLKSDKLIKGLTSYSKTTNCCNIVTSVPISQQRLIERGFNQSSFFAEEVARILQTKPISLLKRLNGFEHTSHLSKEQRIEVVKELYSSNNKMMQHINKQLRFKSYERVNIIIVDDIFTTGYTLQTCASEIRQSIDVPCHIFGITLARA